MLGLDVNKINQQIAQTNHAITTVQQAFANIRQQQANLKNEEANKTDLINNKTRDKKHLEMLKIIAIDVSERVTALRNAILESLATSQRDDVLVKTVERAKQRAIELREELKKHCGHQFVIGCSAYSGSRSFDRDNTHPAERLCLICGFSEIGKVSSPRILSSSDPGVFEIMKNDVQRIVGDGDYPLRLEIWKPLEQLVEEVFNIKKIRKLLDK